MDIRVSGHIWWQIGWRKLRQDPIHKKILPTEQKLQGDDNDEPEEAIRYAVKNENIWFEKPLAPWVIESIKTTSMEDVSKRVLEKIKNI